LATENVSIQLARETNSRNLWPQRQNTNRTLLKKTRMVQDTETQLDNLVFRNSLSTRTTAIELSSHIGKTKSNFDELEARLASLESTVASQGNELANHENQIRILESATHGFAALRHRFLSTAKRDIFGFALTQADNERVAAVDSSASARRYGGNCVFDAKLYEPGGGGRRRDFRTYEKLYGLHPGVVRMIGRFMDWTSI
jgi:hypothetical protein